MGLGGGSGGLVYGLGRTVHVYQYGLGQGSVGFRETRLEERGKAGLHTTTIVI